MKKIRRFARQFFLLILIGTAWSAWAQSKRTLIPLLRQQGFTGALSGDIHFTPLGSIHCAKIEYRVIYFEWYGPAHPGSHRAQYRLIFLQGGKRYVGSYVITDKPEPLRGNSIHMDYGGTPVVITCSKPGSDDSNPFDDGGALFLEK